MECKPFIWMGSVTKVVCKHFKWVEDISEFAGTFIKSYEESDEGYFLEIKKLNILEIYIKPKTIFHLPEGMKIETAEKLVANLHEKN